MKPRCESVFQIESNVFYLSDMSVKYKHSDVYSMYFCTFTCHKWMHLFELTNSYDLVYDWFDILKKGKIEVVGYVIMPNHLHSILYFPEAGFHLDKILSNGKRFMAYELVNRFEKANDTNTLTILQNALTERERKKKQLHKVFKDSFDAKPIFSEKFLMQKLNYIHYNPVKGKRNLAKDPIAIGFVSYEHSSASFYEGGITRHFVPTHYKDL
jgi:putative transposase